MLRFLVYNEAALFPQHTHNSTHMLHGLVRFIVSLLFNSKQFTQQLWQFMLSNFVRSLNTSIKILPIVDAGSGTSNQIRFKTNATIDIEWKMPISIPLALQYQNNHGSNSESISVGKNGGGLSVLNAPWGSSSSVPSQPQQQQHASLSSPFSASMNNAPSAPPRDEMMTGGTGHHYE